MKKKLIAIMAIIIMIPLVLCACKKEQPVDPLQPTTQEAIVEPETRSGPTEDPKAAVTRLMENVNKLKYVHGVALESDDTYIYYDENGYAYKLITDPDFQSIGDIMMLQAYQTISPAQVSAAMDQTEFYPDIILPSI